MPAGSFVDIAFCQILNTQSIFSVQFSQNIRHSLWYTITDCPLVNFGINPHFSNVNRVFLVKDIYSIS